MCVCVCVCVCVCIAEKRDKTVFLNFDNMTTVGGGDKCNVYVNREVHACASF